MVLGLRWRHVQNLGERMRGFERRDDSLQLGANLKRRKRLRVGGGKISPPPRLLQPGMFRPDARIVEPGRDRMPLLDLPVGIRQQIGPVAMQHAWPAAGERGSVLFVEPKTRRLDAKNFHGRIVVKGMEQAYRLGAAADTGK